MGGRTAAASKATTCLLLPTASLLLLSSSLRPPSTRNTCTSNKHPTSRLISTFTRSLPFIDHPDHSPSRSSIPPPHPEQPSRASVVHSRLEDHRIRAATRVRRRPRRTARAGPPPPPPCKRRRRPSAAAAARAHSPGDAGTRDAPRSRPESEAEPDEKADGPPAPGNRSNKHRP